MKSVVNYLMGNCHHCGRFIFPFFRVWHDNDTGEPLRFHGHCRIKWCRRLETAYEIRRCSWVQCRQLIFSDDPRMDEMVNDQLTSFHMDCYEDLLNEINLEQ